MRINKITVISFFLIIGHFLVFAQEEAEQLTKVHSLFNLLSDSGKIIPDVETNSFIVVDYPHNIEMIEAYLNAVDILPQQVLIEARVVEVKLEKEHSLGVNWSLFASKEGAEIGQFRLRSKPTALEERAGITPGLRQFIPFQKPRWEPLKGSEQEPFSIGIFDENINVVLRALTTQLKIDVLSAPKVTTLSNRRAKIDVIKTIPYLKDIKEEREEEEDRTERITITYTYDYTEEGVSLEVTPFINPDRTLTLTLSPQVKDIVRWREMFKPLYAEKAPELPETDIRVVQTKVTVKEGQTLVIGGLIRERIIDGVTKVPFFGNIPFLGFFFRSKIERKEKIELLILLSPTIITPDEFVQMARQEKYGVGRRYIEERERQKEMFLNLEAQERAKKEKQFKEVDLLTKTQERLTEERKKLEDMVIKEEKRLKELEEAKEAIIEKRRGSRKK